jgi:hypothetical protein
MAAIVERIPHLLQAIFGQFATLTARTSGFIQRERGFSGSDFLRVLTFGWLAHPKVPLEPLADELGITTSALQQRMTQPASEFLRTALKQAVQQLLGSRPTSIPLLEKFNGVYAEDCSTISLPEELADQFPGCGGSDEHSGKAALRLFASYELTTGKLQQLEIAKARGSDAVVAGQHAPQLPQGAVRLRDMGFFDRQLFVQDTQAGVFWISRLPASLTVQAEGAASLPVSQYLATQPEHVTLVDCSLWVGQQGEKSAPMQCRFLALRCPQEVAARRRQRVLKKAKKKGRQASPRQLIMCDWTVLITNIPGERLTFAEAWELYCSRWQIELLFKRWKSLGGIQTSTKLKPYRVLCELYAKLLGILVAHWFTLIRGGPLEGFSLTKSIRKIQSYAERIAEALACPELLKKLIAKIEKWVMRLRKQQRRKKHPTTRQRLFHPMLCT